MCELIQTQCETTPRSSFQSLRKVVISIETIAILAVLRTADRDSHSDHWRLLLPRWVCFSSLALHSHAFRGPLLTNSTSPELQLHAEARLPCVVARSPTTEIALLPPGTH